MNLKNKLFAAVTATLLSTLCSFAHADSFQGTVWSLTYSGVALPDADAAHETYRITLGVDTGGYTGSGSFLDQVAIKVSSSIYAASLYAAPGGAAAWSLVGGGISAGGCSGNGGGFECANSGLTLNGGKGVAINAGNGVGIDYSWVFDITVNNGTLFGANDAASVKGRFVNANGGKVGALVSENIPLTVVSSVPEPETYALMLAGLGVVGALARRRKVRQA